MSSAYTLYPQVWIRHGLLPSLPKPLPSLKFACPFLFSSRGTLWDGKQIHPQPSVPSLKQAFPITLNSGNFCLCLLLAILRFLGIPLAHFAIRCRHGLEKWPACRNRIEALLSRLVVHGSFRGSHHGPLSNLCVDHASHCACPVHGSSAGSVPFISKYWPTFPACRESPIPSLLPALLHSRLHVRLSGFTPLCSFNFPKLGSNPVAGFLKYYPSISSSFSKAKTLTVIFLFTLWCLPWITRKLRLTPLLTLLWNLFRTYVA